MVAARLQASVGLPAGGGSLNTYPSDPLQTWILPFFLREEQAHPT